MKIAPDMIGNDAVSYDKAQAAELGHWQDQLDRHHPRQYLGIELAASDDIANVWTASIDTTPGGVMLLMTLIHDTAAAARRLLLPETLLEEGAARAADLTSQLGSALQEPDRDRRRTVLDEIRPSAREEVQRAAFDIAKGASLVGLGRELTEHTRDRLSGLERNAIRIGERAEQKFHNVAIGRTREQLRALLRDVDLFLDDPETWGVLGEVRIDGVRPGSMIAEVSGAGGLIAKVVAAFAMIGPNRERAKNLVHDEHARQIMERMREAASMRDVMGADHTDIVIDQLREELIALNDQRLLPAAQRRVAERAVRPVAVLQRVQLTVVEQPRRQPDPNRPRPLPAARPSQLD